MSIRAARREDLAAIGDIWNAAIRDTAQTFNSVEKSLADLADTFAARQADGHALLVVEDAGRVRGFGTYVQFRGGVGYARTMEHTLYLAADARGRGMGDALLRALEEHARARGMKSLIGGIAGENTGSIRFHERLGYARIATLPQVGYKFGRYMDLVLMQKMLS
ncbi:MAG: N-acetyltransferase family protein [Pseudomonadota bacterium]